MIKVVTNNLIVMSKQNPSKNPVLFLRVGKDVGGAVVRNRVKRVLREAFRRCKRRLPSYEYIFRARSGAGETKNAELFKELDTLYNRLSKMVGS